MKRALSFLVLVTVASWQIQVAVEMGLAASRRPKPITPANSTQQQCKDKQCPTPTTAK